MRKLVGAVGIGLKAKLKTRKLLILLNEKNAKNTGFAQVRYTPGTRTVQEARILLDDRRIRCQEFLRHLDGIE